MLALCLVHPKRDDEHPRLFHMEVSPRELKTNNLIFSAQITGLNPVFKYEKKNIVLLKFTVKFVL